MKIKEIVRDDNMAQFCYYHDGNLWYEVIYTNDDMDIKKILFPVPVSDIGNATFNVVERAMLMMRYIRKHLKTIEDQDNGRN